MTHVELFISYASEDYPLAKRLFATLASMPEIRIWMDKETLLPGEEWEQNIYTAIERCHFFIVLLSLNWVRKDGFVKQELQKLSALHTLAPAGKYTVIPVLLEPCTIDHPFLARIQSVNMFPDWEAGALAIQGAIRRRIHNDIGAAFGQLQKIMRSPAEAAWIQEHGAHLLRLPSENIITLLDAMYASLADELYVVELLAHLAASAHSSVVSDYVFRTFEIARVCGTVNELPTFYGAVLRCAALLPQRTKMVFLRDVFNYRIEHLGPVDVGCWYADLTLRDITKHYICCERSALLSHVTMDRKWHLKDLRVDAAAVTKCLGQMEWDIPVMDLLVFYARRNTEPQVLYAVLDLLRESCDRSLGQGGMLRSKRRLVFTPPTGWFAPLRKTDSSAILKAIRTDRMLWADERQDFCRIGILLRAAQYLVDTNPKYAATLWNQALVALGEITPAVANRLRAMNSDDLQAVFDAIERHDDKGLDHFFEDDRERKSVRLLITETTFPRRLASGDLLHVSLPVGAFTLPNDYPDN